jgi:hypothetical protein
MPPQGASFAGVRVRALEPAGNDGPRGMILERMPTGIREQNPAYSPLAQANPRIEAAKAD